ncbi:MAG: PilC/PilY family type IV pilus protein [Candidatus Competibacter sp.]|nr:PilC/PilY family type IV pilus protein [Candidatus Competibacter sp.]
MTTITNRSCGMAAVAALLGSTLIYPAPAPAALLDLAQVPLFIGSVGVPPNVFFMLDDSGSMDWEMMVVNHFSPNFYDRDFGGSDSTPTNNYPGSEKRWYGFALNGNETAYGTGTLSNLFSYYYNNNDNLYTPSYNSGTGLGSYTTTNGCEGAGNAAAIYNCNPWVLYKPKVATNSTISTPDPIDTTTPILWDWRIFSSAFNTMYYNPAITYRPWKGFNGGVAGPEANYASACSNPQWGNSLCIAPRDLGADDFRIAVWTDDKGYNGATPTRGSNINMLPVQPNTAVLPIPQGSLPSPAPNGMVDLWDTYTLYTIKKGTDTVEVRTFQTNYCPVTMPALAPGNLPPLLWQNCWDLLNQANDNTTNPYRQGRLLVNQLGGTTTYSGAGTVTPLGGLTVAQLKQNVANWYQYYRKRSFVAKNAMGDVVTSFPNFRYGVSVLNQASTDWPSNLFVKMPTNANPPYDYVNTTVDPANKTGLLNKLYGFKWTASGTPLQKGLDLAGQYYMGTASPILAAGAGGKCQQHFTLLMTDGFWNQNFSSTYADTDGDGFQNTAGSVKTGVSGCTGGSAAKVNSTVADVAYQYYGDKVKNPSNPGLAGSSAFNPSPLPQSDWKVFTTPFDQANWPHMVTFTVAFGGQGFLNYPTGSGWPAEVTMPASNLRSSTQWGDPTACDTAPAKVDDLWHAAYNSRGAFFSARNPDELLVGFQKALSSVAARTGSATALSMNSSFVTDTRTATSYIARFNSGDWTGELLAVKINSDGSFAVGAPLWQTSVTFTPSTQSPSSRKIFTATGPLPTAFASLTPAQQTILDKNPVTQLPDGKGQDRLDFIRGKGLAVTDDAWLGSKNFRARSSMLGDIINSDPFFVDYGSQAAIPGVVYVGANDGMLHAFNASTGREVFAFIPSAVFSKLNALPDIGYAHRYYVDGSMVVKDIGNKKILIGTLRGGGQSVFALDVTDPGNFSASNFLWEYSDNDLGYTFSKPTIAKMDNGKWAVVIGNGYNNTQADGSASITGTAILYILELTDTGALSAVKKLNTGVGTSASPNGLATPAVIFDPASPSVAKYAYAGDLLGNLWKFDLSGVGGVAYGGKALFSAKSPSGNQPQPITIRPEVDVHPSLDGYLIYFGTGKYIETTDNQTAGQPTQTLYAVWDRDNPALAPALLPQTRAHLLQQEIRSAGSPYVVTNRQIIWHYDANPANPTNPSGTPPTDHVGWYLDLIVAGNNRGEKQVTNGLLVEKKVVFNTIIPSLDVCDAGGTSNTIILDAISGGRLAASAFKGVPMVPNPDNPTEMVPVSSQPSDTMGILSEPKLVENLETGQNYIVSLGSSGQPDSSEVDPAQQTIGRRFWRQLQQQQ